MKLMPNEEIYLHDVIFDLEMHNHIYWIFSKEEYHMEDAMTNIEEMCEQIGTELHERNPSIHWEAMVEETSKQLTLRIYRKGCYPIRTNKEAVHLLHKF